LEERARSAVELWQDWGLLRSVAEAVLGLLLLARGDIHASRRLLTPLADGSSCSIIVLGWVTAGLARIQLAEGRGDAAVASVAGGLEVIERKGSWAWAAHAAPIAVEALLASGTPTEAAELTRRLDEGLKGRNAPAARAALEVCHALLAESKGDEAGAARGYLAAERAWWALPSPYEAARAREHAGRCLLEGEPERGRRLLVGAMDAFRGLGAAWDEGRTRQTLRDHGAIPPHRGGRKGYGGRLTPREAQVVERASMGKTNREIATELFLSPRTIEHYLTSAMRKLGVTSRTALSAQLETTRR
jgi:DNA-binding CsgD family transcriptional regulator